jgi:hypothetical protein
MISIFNALIFNFISITSVEEIPVVVTGVTKPLKINFSHRRDYWVESRVDTLSLRRFAALPKIVQGRRSTTKSPG